jgi:hypothetical protein
MSPESEQLKSARASGSLSNVIGVLREESKAEAANAPAQTREQVGLEDASIRVAVGLAGKTGAERRETLREVRPGATVSSKGVAKTLLSRAEKLDRVKAWGSTLTEEQRTSYLMSDEFDKLTDRRQEIIATSFGDLEEQALEASLGIQNIDLDAEVPSVDDIIGEDEEDETDESYVDPVDEASLNGETYYTEESQ